MSGEISRFVQGRWEVGITPANGQEGSVLVRSTRKGVEVVVMEHNAQPVGRRGGASRTVYVNRFEIPPVYEQINQVSVPGAICSACIALHARLGDNGFT